MKKIIVILVLGFCSIIFCNAQIANLYSLSSKDIVSYAENTDNDFIEFDEEYTIMHNTISNSVSSDISIRISSQYADDSKYGFNSITLYKDGDILLKLQQEQLWT